MVVPAAGILGTAGIGGLNIDPAAARRAGGAPLSSVEVVAEGLDQVLAGKRVELLKVVRPAAACSRSDESCLGLPGSKGAV